MRGIKFRGKVLYDGYHFFSGNWVEGYLGVKLNVITGKDDYYILQSTYNTNSNSSYFVDILVDAETVGQFTGLPDRNDKNICEGDVVEGEKYSGKVGIYNNHTGVVRFRHESFSSFGINQYKGQKAEMNSLFEVIGNIYDMEVSK